MKHKYDGKYDDLKPELKTCNPGTMKFVTAEDEKQEVKEHSEIIFTYDVTYKVRIPQALAAIRHCTHWQILRGGLSCSRAQSVKFGCHDPSTRRCQ